MTQNQSLYRLSQYGRVWVFTRKTLVAINEMAAGLREPLEQELAVAREIQQALLPKSFRRLRNFQVTATNRPCLAVGGDYFDLTELDDPQHRFCDC